MIIASLQDMMLSMAFSCTSKEQVEFEIKSTLLLILTSPKMKYYLYLTKYIRDLHKETCKILTKDIKKHLNK